MAFDPYHKWLGISPKDQPPDHYRLLGIDRFESDLDVIISAADQRMMHVRRFELGEHAKLCQQMLNAITAARVCLLKPDSKEKYDRQLQENMRPVAAPLASARPLMVTPPPVVSQSPQVGTFSNWSVFGSRARLAGKMPSRQISTAIAAAVAAFSLVIVLLAVNGTSPRQDGQGTAQDARPEEPPVGLSSSLPTSMPRDKVQSSADSEVDPIRQSTTPPDKQRAFERLLATPPAGVSSEPLPSEPEEPGPSDVADTVEAAGQRLREELARCGTPDDFKRVVEAGLVLADQAVVEGSMELARELVVLALVAARKSGDPAFARKVTLRVMELEKPLEAIRGVAQKRLKEADTSGEEAAIPTQKEVRALGDLLE